ncbi:DUF937 domain-containing protein [Pedococcus bigeumensis]|uniref:DUF937 domain-containing protein n=1 Tax=Pedococcus bigeumensis TaxID=433644 RepID=A0A502CTV7_9MICO|nr:DUF937 domain-containing protein [Pedococcus bigeumensis]TPG16122.1 DUF937 domain-containing protein [Pedococcus bigeumensis]
MSAVDEILSQVDLNQLAQQVGADPAEVEQAARTALPALLGGLDANAADPAGAASLTEALGQHDGSLIDGGVDLTQVDPTEGEKIAHHIFGDNQEQVLNQLGGVGGGASKGIVAKLIPILAPIVLSWLAKKVLGGAGGAARTPSGGAGGGGLGDILGQVLGGATKGTQSGGINTGSIISDVLGGLLGGGRR